MQGIDISSNQTGINLTVVPCDFVIVKITQGNYYVNPDAARAVNQALGAGKATGVYCYVGGGGAINEADYFIARILPWLGKVTIWVDWESGQNPNWGNTGYLDQIVKRIKQKTGYARVGIYASSGSFPRAVASANNSPTWVAQYASMAPTGYQGTPWGEGNYQADIRQYASTGRLNGWGGNLDINKLYGTRSTWDSWIGDGSMALSDDDVMKIWTHKLPNGAAVRDCLSPAIEDIFRMHDTGLVAGLWMHKLPNGRFARDIVSDATSDVVRIHDTMLPQLLAQSKEQATQIAALSTAVQTLAQSKGVNPDEISKAVSDAVKTKLESLKITVE